ncbi:hypothetical protein MMC07_009908 [Pseudocyphellaria aurata]|nr:hypothetical protein [Pseudocyphellaria aurata]
MPASSLLQIARKLCIANIRFITDVGDVPYMVARPILLKVETADQLRQIEESSPQICGHDAEVWKELIKRDVNNWEEKLHEPENPRDWYQVYQNLQAESQMEVEADAANLRDTLLCINSERLKHQSKHVHPSTVPPLPKMGAMKLIKTPRKKKIVFVDHRPKLSFNAGSKTKVLTGRGVLEKARREAKEQSFYGSGSILAVPTHKLKASKSQIQTAPKGLVVDYQHQRRLLDNPEPIDPTVRPPPIFAPKRKREEPAKSAASGPMSLEEKERRLKALTTRGKDTTAASSPAAQPRSDSKSSAAPPTISRHQKTSILSSATPTSKVALSQQLPQANLRRVPPPTRTKAPVNPFMPAKRRKLT